MKFYNIHDLIGISASDDIPSNVKEDIDFQIKYFVQSEVKQLKYAINILSFDELSNEYESTSNDIFHLVEGKCEHYLLDPIKKFAVIKTDTGFDIYASRKSFLINFYIQLLFLKEGITMVHAAAVGDEEGNVTLFPGPGGVGKTAIINHFITTKGYKTLGDDIIGLGDDGTCYAFPREFVLKRYHQNVYPEVFKEYGYQYAKELDKKMSYYLDLVFHRMIFKNLPFQGIISSLFYRTGLAYKFKKKQDFFTVPIDKVFGDGSVLLKGKLKNLIFLERRRGTDSEVTQISHDRMTQIMFSIINHEWVDFMREIFSLGALEIMDLKDYMDKTYTSIFDSIGTLSEYHFMKIPEKASPEDLVKIYTENFKD